MSATEARLCRGCGETKPVSAFSRNRLKPDGRNIRCKECDRARLAKARNGFCEVPNLVMAHANAFLAWHDRTYPNGYRTRSFRARFDAMTDEEIAAELDRLQTAVMMTYGEPCSEERDGE